MKKITLTYGLIAGTVVSVVMLFSMNYLSHCNGNVDYGTSMVVGYASMLIAFSLVFVGIKNYRDKHNGGVISFGLAFKIGSLMVLIASTMYVVAWLIDFFYFIPGFIDTYSAHMLAELRASGASQVKIDAKTKEMAEFAIMYRNPFFNAMMTYAEILPVGLIVTLISSLTFKKKPAVEGAQIQ
ncbi:DUF4199 domain-containing protein [Flavobacterium pallidum]|uniref:DUF4199 domain-containing protein n=1 Tax=Flavobacterium pallidum TaxID=2172098 RepID=A0A2S1SLV1_9FLAO|nr:DUF4199 domain-containing protein [Flavobacterium pallidum]AWI27332.1 DUF4199 domain-containing protein [Flavobacterium pallidum]